MSNIVNLDYATKVKLMTNKQLLEEIERVGYETGRYARKLDETKLKLSIVSKLSNSWKIHVQNIYAWLINPELSIKNLEKEVTVMEKYWEELVAKKELIMNEGERRTL